MNGDVCTVRCVSVCVCECSSSGIRLPVGFYPCALSIFMFGYFFIIEKSVQCADADDDILCMDPSNAFYPGQSFVNMIFHK